MHYTSISKSIALGYSTNEERLRLFIPLFDVIWYLLMRASRELRKEIIPRARLSS